MLTEKYFTLTCDLINSYLVITKKENGVIDFTNGKVGKFSDPIQYVVEFPKRIFHIFGLLEPDTSQTTDESEGTSRDNSPLHIYEEDHRVLKNIKLLNSEVQYEIMTHIETFNQFRICNEICHREAIELYASNVLTNNGIKFEKDGAVRVLIGKFWDNTVKHWNQDEREKIIDNVTTSKRKFYYNRTIRCCSQVIANGSAFMLCISFYVGLYLCLCLGTCFTFSISRMECMILPKDVISFTHSLRNYLWIPAIFSHIFYTSFPELREHKIVSGIDLLLLLPSRIMLFLNYPISIFLACTYVSVVPTIFNRLVNNIMNLAVKMRIKACDMKKVKKRFVEEFCLNHH